VPAAIIGRNIIKPSLLQVVAKALLCPPYAVALKPAPVAPGSTLTNCSTQLLPQHQNALQVEPGGHSNGIQTKAFTTIDKCHLSANHCQPVFI
jgi:hypothetical protein